VRYHLVFFNFSIGVLFCGPGHQSRSQPNVEIHARPGYLYTSTVLKPARWPRAFFRQRLHIPGSLVQNRQDLPASGETPSTYALARYPGRAVCTRPLPCNRAVPIFFRSEDPNDDVTFGIDA